MPTETFSVRTSPKTAANKALGIMRRAKLANFKLKESGVTQREDGYIACARWEEAGFFGGSAELRVEARKPYYGPTEITVTAPGDKFATLAERLRKGL
jgi:hypothetical protein